MFCPKCGAENRDGARFCGKCGQGLDKTSVGSTHASDPRGKWVPPLAWGVGAAVLTLVLALAVLHIPQCDERHTVVSALKTDLSLHVDRTELEPGQEGPIPITLTVQEDVQAESLVVRDEQSVEVVRFPVADMEPADDGTLVYTFVFELPAEYVPEDGSGSAADEDENDAGEAPTGLVLEVLLLDDAGSTIDQGMVPVLFAAATAGDELQDEAGVLNNGLVVHDGRIYFSQNEVADWCGFGPSWGGAGPCRDGIVSCALDGSDAQLVFDLPGSPHILQLLDADDRLVFYARDADAESLWSIKFDGADPIQIASGQILGMQLYADERLYYAIRPVGSDDTWEIHSCRSDGTADTLICESESFAGADDGIVESYVSKIMGIADGMLLFDADYFYENAAGGLSIYASGTFASPIVGGDCELVLPSDFYKNFTVDSPHKDCVAGGRLLGFVEDSLYSIPYDGSADSAQAVIELSEMGDEGGFIEFQNATSTGGLFTVTYGRGYALYWQVYTGESYDFRYIDLGEEYPCLFNIYGGTVYYSTSDGAIMRCDLDGSGPEEVYRLNTDPLPGFAAGDELEEESEDEPEEVAPPIRGR